VLPQQLPDDWTLTAVLTASLSVSQPENYSGSNPEEKCIKI